jgi:predicted SAM-dependent methyltransferase
LVVKSYLNLGCGSRHHPDWINIDIAPQDPGVIQYDLSRGIPLADATCDVVYHTAVLEHIRRADAAAFLRECNRVLKPGGIIRVGVPDLEKICQIYLSKMQAALNGDETAAHDYDWMILELYDQTVRERSGGGMTDYLQKEPLPNETFIYERIGEEGRLLVKALRSENDRVRTSSHTSAVKTGILRILWRRVLNLPDAMKLRLLWRLLGSDGMRALKIGRFRLAGEVHQWMYDRYSLACLLLATGFCDPIKQSATISRIPNWTSFHLDTLADGSVIKPDLLFMEAIKPEAKIHG